MKEIHGENYNASYDSSIGTVVFNGSLRLYGNEGYLPIAELLDQIADEQRDTITLNLKELQFLNSAGINTISKFVIKVRNLKKSKIVVKGSQEFPWQSKSLRNLERLMPNGLTLEIE